MADRDRPLPLESPDVEQSEMANPFSRRQSISALMDEEPLDMSKRRRSIEAPELITGAAEDLDMEVDNNEPVVQQSQQEIREIAESEPMTKANEQQERQEKQNEKQQKLPEQREHKEQQEKQDQELQGQSEQLKQQEQQKQQELSDQQEQQQEQQQQQQEKEEQQKKQQELSVRQEQQEKREKQKQQEKREQLEVQEPMEQTEPRKQTEQQESPEPQEQPEQHKEHKQKERQEQYEPMIYQEQHEQMEYQEQYEQKVEQKRREEQERPEQKERQDRQQLYDLQEHQQEQREQEHQQEINLQQTYQESKEAADPSQPPAQQQSKGINTVFICKLGQETVQDIYIQAFEIFKYLTELSLPNGTVQVERLVRDKKLHLQDKLKIIKMRFKHLHRIFHKCNENCPTQGMKYANAESFIPLKESYNFKTDQNSTSEVHRLACEEKKILIEQIAIRNRQLNDIIFHLRRLISELNAMLHMRLT